MKRTTQAAATSAMLALTLTSSAHACGFCAFAEAEAMLPPVVPWSILGPIAYCLVPAIIPAERGTRYAWVFSPGWVCVIVIALSAFGFSAVGPLAFIPMLGLACIGSARALKRARTNASVGFAAVLAIAIIGSGVYSTWRAGNRDEVDRMVRWPSTPPSRQSMERLRRANDLTTLRRILQESDGYEAVSAAAHLVHNGQFEVDGPLMISAIRRLEAGGDKDTREAIGWELERLLDMKLPDTSTADDWQRAYDSRVEFLREKALLAPSKPE